MLSYILLKGHRRPRLRGLKHHRHIKLHKADYQGIKIAWVRV